MLYIIIDEVEKHWHIGEPAPTCPENATNIIVQADCDELDYILQHFTNLPCSDKHVVRWFGETAKFIACNLGR